MAERWIITGASGQLGGHVLRALRAVRPSGSLLALAGRGGLAISDIPLSRIDLRNGAALRELVAAYRPTHVLHLGAMTSVAECRQRPDDARKVNVDATRALAEAAAASRARFVFASTDMVFAGDGAPYAESAEPDAVSVYGRSKIEAEQALKREGGAAAQGEAGAAAGRAGGLIVRLPLLYGLPATERATTFAQQIAALRAGEPLRLFDDEYRTPLALVDAARALVGLARSGATGVLHVAGPERLSRLELIERVAAALGIAGARLDGVSRVSSDAPEPRPEDLSLDASRFLREFADLAPRPLSHETIVGEA